MYTSRATVDAVNLRKIIMSTTLITGGHAGIGFECASQLASQSRRNLVLAGRSPERMESAAQQLRTAYGVRVTTLKLDTSSLTSVREAATEFRAMLDRGEIDSFQALLCNAGGRHNGPLSYSPEGYETTFATNCLGHFLLIELLTDRMADNGRIVFTASGTHDPDTTDGKMVGLVAGPDALALANDGKDAGNLFPRAGATRPPSSARFFTRMSCTVGYGGPAAPSRRLLSTPGPSLRPGCCARCRSLCRCLRKPAS